MSIFRRGISKTSQEARDKILNNFANSYKELMNIANKKGLVGYAAHADASAYIITAFSQSIACLIATGGISSESAGELIDVMRQEVFDRLDGWASAKESGAAKNVVSFRDYKNSK